MSFFKPTKAKIILSAVAVVILLLGTVIFTKGLIYHIILPFGAFVYSPYLSIFKTIRLVHSPFILIYTYFWSCSAIFLLNTQTLKPNKWKIIISFIFGLIAGFRGLFSIQGGVPLYDPSAAILYFLTSFVVVYIIYSVIVSFIKSFRRKQ